MFFERSAGLLSLLYRLAGWALLFFFQEKKVSKKSLVDCTLSVAIEYLWITFESPYNPDEISGTHVWLLFYFAFHRFTPNQIIQSTFNYKHIWVVKKKAGEIRRPQATRNTVINKYYNIIDKATSPPWRSSKASAVRWVRVVCNMHWTIITPISSRLGEQ